MSNFKQIAVGNIIANQSRNFKLHPMSKKHVASLVESYEKSGDFGVIAVREMEDGSYEQAMGHHRLAALKEMGFTYVDCKVSEMDDNDMVRVMVNENNTQQGNVNPAKLDSINAIMGQVAFAILLSDTPEQYLETIGSNSGDTPKLTQRGMVEAKNRIAKGESVPHVWLKAFDGDVVGSDKTVNELTAQLKDGGFLEQTYATVQAEIEEITAAKEEEDRILEAARVKAEKKAELERIAYEKAAAAARVAAKKAKASQKAAAEANAKEQDRIAKERAKARVVEARKREEEREEANRQREIRYEAKQVAKAAAKASAELEKGLHPDVLHMLSVSTHQAAFRKIVTSDIGKRVFPIGKQVDVVRAMIKSHGDDEMTTVSIREYLSLIIQRTDDDLKRIIAEREAADVKRSVVRKVHNVLDDFRRSSANTAMAFRKMGGLLDDEDTRDYTLGELASDRKLSEMVDDLEKMIMTIRASVKLHQSHYQASTIDHNANRGKIISSQ